MTNELIRPIDAETARAIEEAAKLGIKVVDAGTGAGGYLAGVLGTVPQSLVGFIGDWLVHKRIRRWAELAAETKTQLQKWGAKEPYEDISPSLAVPLIEAAIDEDRAVLKDLWVKLLASAMHPERKYRVRRSFFDTLKRMDPLDALVFMEIRGVATNSQWHSTIATKLAREPDEITLSIETLKDLKLIELLTVSPKLTAHGRLFEAAVCDDE